MQIELQEMFLLFMKQVNHSLIVNSAEKRKCFVFLHKAQNEAMKASQVKEEIK